MQANSHLDSGSGLLSKGSNDRLVGGKERVGLVEYSDLMPRGTEQAEPHIQRHGVAMGVDGDDTVRPGPRGAQLRPQVGLADAEHGGDCPAKPQVWDAA